MNSMRRFVIGRTHQEDHLGLEKTNIRIKPRSARRFNRAPQEQYKVSLHDL